MSELDDIRKRTRHSAEDIQTLLRIATELTAERDKLAKRVANLLRKLDTCSDEHASAWGRAERAEAERDKLAYMIEYIESLDPVIVGWARAGFQQEAKP